MALEKRFKEAFAACPVCGGELAEKRVTKLLRGGTDTATVEVDALVCRRCGERLYPEETVRLFERIRAKLRRGETQDMTLVGSSYEAPSD
jgi:YgiT-type zinc finger domain-containing protein